MRNMIENINTKFNRFGKRTELGISTVAMWSTKYEFVRYLGSMFDANG